MMRDPAEQLIRSLYDDALLASKIPRPEDLERIVGERRRRHVGTVRSAAHARNRPRGRLAWLIGLAVVALLILAARANADTGELDDVDDLIEAAETAPDLAAAPETEPLASDVPVGGELSAWDTSLAGSQEQLEAMIRGKQPSRWGRLDVAIAWQRSWADPAESAPTRHDEVWLLATWWR